MKKIRQWMSSLFEPEQFNDLDIFSVADALNDSEIRRRWMTALLEEVRKINQDVDRRLLSGMEFGLMDLCARRKAIQDMLELVLSVKRQLKQDAGKDVRHNPLGQVNLDRVTA